jgi:hypothetical protein
MHTFTTKNPQSYCTLLFAMCMLAATLTASIAARAQDTLPFRPHLYKTKLTLRNGQKLDGYLKHVTDSTVVYTLTKSPVGSPAMASDNIVGYAELAKVSLRRKGSVGSVAIGGGAVGAAVGAVAGFASGDDEPRSGWIVISPMSAGEKAGALAFLGALPGALIGALIGTKSKKFSMDGTKEGWATLQTFYKKIYGKATPLND